VGDVQVWDCQAVVSARSPLLWRASAFARSFARSEPPLTMFSLPAAGNNNSSEQVFSPSHSGLLVQLYHSRLQLVWREQQRAGVSTTGPHQRPGRAAAGRNPSVGALLQPVNSNQPPNVSVQADKNLNVGQKIQLTLCPLGAREARGLRPFAI
jgi:hypothetical protein